LSDTIRACRAADADANANANADFTIASLESIRAQDALTQFGIIRLLAPDRLFNPGETKGPKTKRSLITESQLAPT
jgi:hypothetical protein